MGDAEDQRRRGDEVSPIEWALAALGSGVMAWAAQAYHPTQPSATMLLRGCFLGVSLYCLTRAVGWYEAPSRLAQTLRLLIGLLLLWALLQTMGTTIAVTHMWWPALAKTVIGAELLLIMVTWLWRQRTHRPRPLTRTLATLAFINAFGFIPLCAYFWQPPSALECEDAAARDGVVRLSDQSLADNLSYPYEVLYIPEEDMVAASFKMAGNTVLSFWDVEEANKLLLFSTRDPWNVETATVDLTGEALPEHLVYNRGRREVVVNRVGYRDNTIDFIPLDRFPQVALRHSEPIHFPPHGLVQLTDGQRLGVFSADFRFAEIEPVEGKVQRQRQVERGGPNAVVTNLAHTSGSDTVYLSTFGRQIGVYSLEGQPTVHVDVPFAGGDLVMSEQDKRVYQTDMMFGALNIIDTRSKTLVGREKLGYQPRPIAVDTERDLLFVGSWFTGFVHLYRRSTLEALGSPVFVGTYLRKFSYDQQRAILYAGSRCGVYQLNIETLWPTWGSG